MQINNDIILQQVEREIKAIMMKMYISQKENQPNLNKVKSTGLINNNGHNNSTSHIDHSAEEIKETGVKPYNFISDKTKVEILNKMKNKEKYNSNWFNESESSSLSYSKVFNASGRDYGKNLGITNIGKENGSGKENENVYHNKDDNFEKIISYSPDKQKHKFSSYNFPIKERSNSENSKESVDSDCNDEYIDINYNESKENSDRSPDNTKKNILIHDNIILPENDALSLEEVKEYENESHSQETDRKNSTGTLILSNRQ